MDELEDQCKVVLACFVTGNTMEELGDQCKVVLAYFVTGNTTAQIQTPKVIKEFHPKEWALEDDEQVLYQLAAIALVIFLLPLNCSSSRRQIPYIYREGL
jgi:hypothetical protein